MIETPQTRYDAKNRISYCLRLNKKTDADVIKRLEEVKASEGMQSYIKRLIREDMRSKKYFEEKNAEVEKYQSLYNAIVSGKHSDLEE